MRPKLWMWLLVVALAATAGGTAWRYLETVEQFRDENPLVVNVRWAVGVRRAQRVELEKQFFLEAGQRRQGRTWKYTLRDASPDNLRRLVQAPPVEDTHGIDRESFVLGEPVQVPRLALAMRAGGEVAAVLLPLFLVVSAILAVSRSSRLRERVTAWGSALVVLALGAILPVRCRFRAAVFWPVAGGIVLAAVLCFWVLEQRPDELPKITVTWQEQAGSTERADRETRYGLVSPHPIDSAQTDYYMIRWSTADVRALVEEPLVDATEGIDLELMQPADHHHVPWRDRALPIALLALAVGMVMSSVRRVQLRGQVWERVNLAASLAGVLLLVLAARTGNDHAEGRAVAPEDIQVEAVYQMDFGALWRLHGAGWELNRQGRLFVDGHWRLVDALDAAVLSDEPNALRALEILGAPVSARAKDLVCFARAEDRAEAAEYLAERFGSGRPIVCESGSLQ